MNIQRSICVLLLLSLMLPLSAQQAQQTKADYLKVLNDRSVKIVQTLGLRDSAVYREVVDILVTQYKTLGEIHDPTDAAIDSIKKSGNPTPENLKCIKQLENERDARLYELHAKFLGLLSARLNADQVEAIKNGMTFNVMNVTLRAQFDMIPTLKEEEKTQIRAYLYEARERAMDMPSSDRKHAMFGKYKGRINIYLDKRGYNLTKERDQWMERQKAVKK